MTVVKRGQTVTPYLYYEDAAAAIDWLSRAFGFTERYRLAFPNGDVGHAELALDDGVVMIGGVGPRNAARPTTVRCGVYVFVDDVDAHHARARDAGAEIVGAPEDKPYGDRIYLAVDPEGHEWYFAQHMRDVALEDLVRSLGA